jgi:hypothetical protein
MSHCRVKCFHNTGVDEMEHFVQITFPSVQILLPSISTRVYTYILPSSAIAN